MTFAGTRVLVTPPPHIPTLTLVFIIIGALCIQLSSQWWHSMALPESGGSAKRANSAAEFFDVYIYLALSRGQVDDCFTLYLFLYD